MSNPEHPLRLMAYVDGELDAAAAEAIGRHLQSCAGCRGEVEALRWLQRESSRLSSPEGGESLWPSLQERLPHRGRGVRAVRPAWAAYALLVLVGLLLGAWAGRSVTAETAGLEGESDLLASSSLFAASDGSIAALCFELPAAEEDRP